MKSEPGVPPFKEIWTVIAISILRPVTITCAVQFARTDRLRIQYSIAV
ncbi:hypothetical protein JMJ77_0008581, partial [Colletotrichum scovillei]